MAAFTFMRSSFRARGADTNVADERPADSEPAWVELPDEKLLEMRMCDLGLRVGGTLLDNAIAELRRDLRRAKLRFRPHFWLGEEWFTPDGVPGVAIPFYLAHPRLVALEQRQVYDAEGGTPDSCLRILRHEAGHAIDNAFRLRRRRDRPRVFGRSGQPYPQFYTPRPYSRRYVIHLERWYAQSHPDEDFAETFAVWVSTPDDVWRKRYAGWPALKKLEWVQREMTELRGKLPPVRTRRRVEPIHTVQKTLGEHYAAKREYYGLDYPSVDERDLRRIFSAAPKYRQNMSAARFVRRIRREVRRTVAQWTGIYQYTIDQVLADIIERSRELELRLTVPEEEARLGFGILLAVQTMNYIHSGRQRVVL
jgi:hypothetical protein